MASRDSACPPAGKELEVASGLGCRLPQRPPGAQRAELKCSQVCMGWGRGHSRTTSSAPAPEAF